jgi:hypothetical protein
MLQVEKQSIREEDSSEVEISPFITVNMQNNEFITLEIELHLEISSNNSKKEIKIGEALLHLVDEQWVSGSLIEHVTYKAGHSDFRSQLHLKNLQTGLERLAESKTKCNGTIAFMYYIVIHEHYRGKGFVKAYLWLILRFLKEKEINNILLQADPLNKQGMDKIGIIKEQRRLERIYLKSGLHILKTKKTIRTNEVLPIRYMFCNLEKRGFSELK